MDVADDAGDNLDECQMAYDDLAELEHHHMHRATLSSDSSRDATSPTTNAAPSTANITVSCDRVTDAAAEPAEWNLAVSQEDTDSSASSWCTNAVVSSAPGLRQPTEIIINLPDPPSPSIRTRLRLRKPKSPPPQPSHFVQAQTPSHAGRPSSYRGLPKFSRPRRGTNVGNGRRGGSRRWLAETAAAAAAANPAEDSDNDDDDDESEAALIFANEQRRKLRKRSNCVSYREDNIVVTGRRESSGDESPPSEDEEDEGSRGGGGGGQREKVRCQQCNKEFEKRYLKLHLQKHSGERPHVCNVCQKSFISKYNVKLHQQRCHSDKKTFDCDLCRRTFSSKHAATEHRRTHTGERPYRCRVCSREFSHMSAWTSHERTHNPTLLKVFLCDLCDKTFKHKRSLQKHCESVHQGIRKAHAYLCATCGQSYDSHSKLKVHQYRHTGERPFSCSECKKSFMTKDVLRNHALIHANIKPFQCEFCGRKFRQAITFKRHRSTHTGVKPFRCDRCNKTFIHRVYMARHKSQNLCYKTRRGANAAAARGGKGGGSSKPEVTGNRQVAGGQQAHGDSAMVSS